MAAVTMTTVAREAGVSVSTVSHVVNGTRPVHPETRKLVLDVMERLGFRHKPVAGSLAAGSTTTIGLAMSGSVHPALRELADGVEEEAGRRGLQMVLVDTHDEPEAESRVVARLLAHHIAGLLIVPSPGWQDSTLKLLRERSVPFVVVDRVQDINADQVGIENESAATSLIDHLLQRGRRRIAYVGCVDAERRSEARLNGYRAAHARRDVPVDADLIRSTCGGEEGARRAAAELLAREDRPDAVACASYAALLGTLRAARHACIGMPDDLAVVGFDDPPWADVVGPSLTVLAQPWYAIGARAVQLLVRRMSDPEAPTQSLLLAGEIVHRESCGCESQKICD